MKKMSSRSVLVSVLVVVAVLLGVVGGAVAGQSLAVPAPDVALIEEAPSGAEIEATEATVFVPSTTTATTTAPPATPTTTTTLAATVIVKRNFNEGYKVGKEMALAGGEIPDLIGELQRSGQANDKAYADGFIGGWIVGVNQGTLEPQPAATPSTRTAAPAPAPAPAPAAPMVTDRGFEQGKEDGYVAGYADGRNHTWNANAYVVGQGPGYTAGFHEAYDYWYSVASKRASQAAANQRLRDVLGSISCVSSSHPEDC